MEEGGGILCNYNGDRLATAAYKHKQSRRWIASGCNIFGQLDITKDHCLKIQQFEEFETNCWLLTCSWSYLASAIGCHLQLQGFVSNRHKTVKLLSANDNIKSLAACDRFCLVLLDNGKLYKCLPQCEDIQLEEVKFQGNQNRVSTYKRSIFSSKDVHNTDSIKIKHIACGNNIMVAIGIANELFTGTTQSGFQFPTHVHPKQLVCGFEHALLLTSNGDIYSWGNGLRGQLGHDVLRVEETPTILEALAGIKITYITSSGWHSAAISIFGDVYTWGFNSNGQLGIKIYKNDTLIKEPTIYHLPQLINLKCQCEDTLLNANCIPIKAGTGSRHTILIMNCGSVYVAGWNVHGQIGSKEINSYCDVFKYVYKVNSSNIEDIEIACGNWCTLIGIL